MLLKIRCVTTLTVAYTVYIVNNGVDCSYDEVQEQVAVPVAVPPAVLVKKICVGPVTVRGIPLVNVAPFS